MTDTPMTDARQIIDQERPGTPIGGHGFRLHVMMA